MKKFAYTKWGLNEENLAVEGIYILKNAINPLEEKRGEIYIIKVIVLALSAE